MFINTYMKTYLTTLLKEEFGMASLEQFKNMMSFVPLLKSPKNQEYIKTMMAPFMLSSFTKYVTTHREEENLYASTDKQELTDSAR